MSKLANILLGLAIAFLFAVLAYGVHRWTGGALHKTEVVLYVAIPAAGMALLIACFKLDGAKKASLALCLVATGAGVYTAEGYVVLSDRRNQTFFV